MPQRRYDIDWLRALAVLLLVYWHSGMFFFRYLDFYLSNSEKSAAIGAFIIFVNQWHMPLFFLLSGVASYYSLSNRGPYDYLAERTKKLLIPLLFGIAVVVPPIIYMQRLSEPGFNMSYFEFYPHFFTGRYPNGNFKPAHLWFLVYLFTFSVILLPIMLFLKDKRREGILSKISNVFNARFGIFLLGIPIAISEALLKGRWAGGHTLIYDWSNDCLYSLVFLYGFLFCVKADIWDSVERHRKSALLLGLMLTVAIFSGKYWNINWNAASAHAFYNFVIGMNIWFWLVTILGFGRRHLNFNNKVLDYAAGFSYPLFIIHLTITVWVARYVLKWQSGVFIKFFVISTLTLIISMAVYDLIIKRTNVTRFLFGMNPLKKDKPSR